MGSILRRNGDCGAGRLAVGADGNHTLFGITECLRHTGGTRAEERSTGDNRTRIIIQCGGVPLIGAHDGDVTAGNLQRAVGIYPVPRRVNKERAAGYDDGAV